MDGYDAPFLNAPPEKLSVVEAVIEELFYTNVLAAFGGFGATRPRIIVMGSGIDGYDAPAKSIADYLGLVDCTWYHSCADLIGLTLDDVKDAIWGLVEDEGARLVLFKNIEERCWRESFVEGSPDVEGVLCSKEVTQYLTAASGLKFETYWE